MEKKVPAKSPQSLPWIPGVTPADSPDVRCQKATAFWTTVVCLGAHVLQIVLSAAANSRVENRGVFYFEAVGNGAVATFLMALLVAYATTKRHALLRYGLFIVGPWVALCCWFTNGCDVLSAGSDISVLSFMFTLVLFCMGGTWTEAVVYAVISSLLTVSLYLLHFVQLQIDTEPWCPFSLVPETRVRKGLQAVLLVLGAQVVLLLTIRMFLKRLERQERAMQRLKKLLKGIKLNKDLSTHLSTTEQTTFQGDNCSVKSGNNRAQQMMEQVLDGLVSDDDPAIPTLADTFTDSGGGLNVGNFAQLLNPGGVNHDADAELELGGFTRMMSATVIGGELERGTLTRMSSHVPSDSPEPGSFNRMTSIVPGDGQELAFARMNSVILPGVLGALVGFGLTGCMHASDQCARACLPLCSAVCASAVGGDVLRAVCALCTEFVEDHTQGR